MIAFSVVLFWEVEGTSDHLPNIRRRDSRAITREGELNKQVLRCYRIFAQVATMQLQRYLSEGNATMGVC